LTAFLGRTNIKVKFEKDNNTQNAANKSFPAKPIMKDKTN